MVGPVPVEAGGPSRASSTAPGCGRGVEVAGNGAELPLLLTFALPRAPAPVALGGLAVVLVWVACVALAAVVLVVPGPWVPPVAAAGARGLPMGRLRGGEGCGGGGVPAPGGRLPAGAPEVADSGFGGVWGGGVAASWRR